MASSIEVEIAIQIHHKKGCDLHAGDADRFLRQAGLQASCPS